MVSNLPTWTSDCGREVVRLRREERGLPRAWFGPESLTDEAGAGKWWETVRLVKEEVISGNKNHGVKRICTKNPIVSPLFFFTWEFWPCFFRVDLQKWRAVGFYIYIYT